MKGTITHIEANYITIKFTNEKELIIPSHAILNAKIGMEINLSSEDKIEQKNHLTKFFESCKKDLYTCLTHYPAVIYGLLFTFMLLGSYYLIEKGFETKIIFVFLWSD